MSGKIFINYRRGDDPGNTGRLFDRLHDAFAPEELFLDVDNIAPGLDFVRVLNERVGECDILLAVIGKGWVEARDGKGNRRLDDPDDFVRIEIESALNQEKRVIPVLVGDTPMPRWEDLPQSLQPLARRNAVRLTHERFRADSQGLIKALQQALIDIDEHKRVQAQTEAERRAEEQSRLAAVEAARLAQERVRQEEAAAEAREQAAQERRRAQEVEAARRAEEKARKDRAAAEERERAAESRALAAARRLSTVAAIEAYLSAYPDGHLADEAKQLKETLLARAGAYHDALASEEVAVLNAFVRSYGKGADVDQVRARLKRLEPRAAWKLPALGAAAAIALTIGIGGLLVVRSQHGSAPTGGGIASQSAGPASPVAADVSASGAAPIPSASVTAPPALPQTAALPAEPKTATEPKPAEPDEIAWQLIEDSKDINQIKRFIERFPASGHRTEAENRIASLLPAAVSVAATNPHELVRSLQFELQRVGCFDGTISGDFDQSTQAAWARFVKLASITAPDAQSSDAIAALRAVNNRICPLVCRSGQHAEGKICVANPPPQSAAPARAAANNGPAVDRPHIVAPPPGFVGGGGFACRNRNMHRLPGGGCGY
jgi:hypothetical protein